MILIPINSALNPFLYSDLPDIIWERFTPLPMWFFRKCCLPVRGAIRGKILNSLSTRTTRTRTLSRTQTVMAALLVILRNVLGYF